MNMTLHARDTAHKEHFKEVNLILATEKKSLFETSDNIQGHRQSFIPF